MKTHLSPSAGQPNLKETSPLQDLFSSRHVGPTSQELKQMVQDLGLDSLGQLVDRTVPEHIRYQGVMDLSPCSSEAEAQRELLAIAQRNQIFRSYIGMGYSDSITPPVIQRNILENPGWYTQYTPYQAEIAQGRLEALLNFQTLISDMTGLPIANASLLDEATAAAEAMVLCYQIQGRPSDRAFLISSSCHPQTLAVVKTRAEPLGIKLIVGDVSADWSGSLFFGVLLQYPQTDGTIIPLNQLIDNFHQAGALVILACDLLSLAILKSPGELGADVAVGNSQRFGVPLGFGGPHAAFISTREEYKRQIPGRIVGVSQDVDGRPAIRLALQTREQHIRRDKATSNICTAQVLLAIMASMYAVYHGPNGLRRIAERVHGRARVLAAALQSLGFKLSDAAFFDTLRITVSEEKLKSILNAATAKRINFRKLDDQTLCVALDETVGDQDLQDIYDVFLSATPAARGVSIQTVDPVSSRIESSIFRRQGECLTHSVFNSYHSETEMLRYIFRLQSKDLSLAHSMIPLGSCTMKLNSTSEMLPVSWPEFSKIHPFAPRDQVQGYQLLIEQLGSWLKEITGFSGVSLQPNAGSQGEYAGLLVIREYLRSRGEGHRDICLIPRSAHGTNPASAAMAGMKVVAVDCDAQGNVDLLDLKKKALEYQNSLAALMITYPSTHGVFEDTISEVCSVVHERGGQVYMDGANMNAQIGLCRPGDFGPDVCHLNLHKTFCIPHGGGGPGMGPICVARHLVDFLPDHPVTPVGSKKGIGPVSAAAWGSASILPISWMYIRMMGSEGLTLATQVAILNANYIAKRLSPYFPVLYRGKTGWVAHECIFDLRRFKETANIEVEDVAKRLMDYGFHAPTVSFPVAGTIMVEPTESEGKRELDRFCDAMISIRNEIQEIEDGKADRQNNLLKNAPHTALHVTKTEWSRSYSRERAAFPAEWTRQNKFWPSVGRINNVLGDRNLICSCPAMDTYES
jgi:glycine dehydrogenase